MANPTTPPIATPPAVLQVTAGMQRGGVEQGTLEMAAYIAHKGWRSLVASAEGQMVEDLLRTGAEHFPLPLTRRTPWHIVSNAFALARIIKDNQIDLVHARSRAPAWAAYMACRMTKTPFITTFHGTYGLRGLGKKWYNGVMTKGIKTIAISKFIAEHIQKHYQVPPSQIVVVPRGFDPQRIDPSLVDMNVVEGLWAEWAVPSATPVILLPARVTRWKGHEILIRALAEIKHLPWRAVFVGGYSAKEGFFYQMWALAEKLGLRDRMIFLGDRADMANLYAAADVVVCPAIAPEAFGRTAVEAQAMEKPVIASAHGGALETIKSGESGWLVRPGDPKRLALALADAITDMPRLKKMGKIGRKWVQENFTAAQMCQGEFAVYEHLITPHEDTAA